MEVRWTRDRTQHIATRSHRYPDSIDIDVEWTSEAATPGRWSSTRTRGRAAEQCRIVGYSPTAGFVLTVIAARIEGELFRSACPLTELWGVTAWKTTGAERRSYQEAHDDDAI